MRDKIPVFILSLGRLHRYSSHIICKLDSFVIVMEKQTLYSTHIKRKQYICISLFLLGY